MPPIFKLSRTGLKLLYKVRHHRGHGIHSPFVFNLITKVIEEKSPYHAYEDIMFVLDTISEKHLRLNKHNKLVFRLVNHFGSKKILEIGSGTGVNTLCLTAHSSEVDCVCVETSPEKYGLAQKLYSQWNKKIILYTDNKIPLLTEKQDCIYIDLNNYRNFSVNQVMELIEYYSYEKTFIIVKGIRTNKHCQALWKGVMNVESRTAVLDLFNTGIVFFDKQLYRWSYQISF